MGLRRDSWKEYLTRKEYLNSLSAEKRNTGPLELHLEHTFTYTQFKGPKSLLCGYGWMISKVRHVPSK